MRSRSVLLLALIPIVSLMATSTVSAQEAEAPRASIQMLNPSAYGDVVVASARDLQDHGYHLVTTVDEVPPQPHVRFEIESEDTGRRRIGIAAQEGPDTFGLHWLIPPEEDLESGAYTLRAILFSNGKQIAEDSMGITVEQSRPTVTLDHATSEVLGVYQPPGDEEVWNTILNYTYSSGSEIVAFFYSMSPPGSEPEWTGCGSVRVSSSLGAGAEEPRSGRFVCELGEGEDATKLTSVAAIATDDPYPLPRTGDALLFGDASGDAHRVLPYRQAPMLVRLSVDGPLQYQTDKCTEQIVASVSDQNGRPVAGANVDVHATGADPTDGRAGLRFDVSRGSGGTDDNQAPDQNHQDETEAWSCKPRQAAGPAELLGPGPSGTQGNHRRPGGGDTRHIEATEPGSNAGGRFRLRLFNDQAGGAQITAWADLDGDDAYCAREPAGHLALGWDQPAPGIDPHRAEQSTCKLPGDIDEVQGKRLTRHARDVSIRTKARGRRLSVRGRVRVRSGHASCRRRAPVNVQRRKNGEWQTLRSPNTDRKGRYRVNIRKRNGMYRAVAVRVYRGENFEHQCSRAAKKFRRR